MATIDQNGNAFGTDMVIGTTDAYAVNIKTSNTNKVGIDTNGRVGIGVATPTPFNASATLFPSLVPKMEIVTGTAYTAYNEGLVIRHNGHDVNAVNRNVGVIFKLSNEVDANESSKTGAIMLSGTNSYANNPNMNFYMGWDSNPKMQILNNGSIKMSSLAGTGTRMVTADSSGNLSSVANNFLTSISGTANRISVSGTTIDIASTYVGQTSITTLGTIGTGTWNGTTIDVGHGGTGLTSAGISGQILVSDGTGFVLSTPPEVISGAYAPTVTIGVGSVTSSGFTFMKIKDVVTVNGIIDCSGIVSGVNNIKVTLPISSSFSANEQLNGVITGTDLKAASPNFVIGDANSGEANVNFHAVGGTATVYIQFQYQVI